MNLFRSAFFAVALAASSGSDVTAQDFDNVGAESWVFHESDNWQVRVNESSFNRLDCTATTFGESYKKPQFGAVFLAVRNDADGDLQIILGEEGVIFAQEDYFIGFHVDNDRLGTKLTGFGSNKAGVYIPVPKNRYGENLISRIMDGNTLKIYEPSNFDNLYWFDLRGSKTALLELSRCSANLSSTPNL